MKKIYATEWTCQMPGSARKGVAVLFCHQQFKIKPDKADDTSSTSDPESAVNIQTQQQERTLGPAADMELICILLL